MCVWVAGRWVLSVLSAKFFCEPKNSLKNPPQSLLKYNQGDLHWSDIIGKIIFMRNQEIGYLSHSSYSINIAV